MTNPINQPYKAHTAPRNSGPTSNEVVKNRATSYASESPEAMSGNQSIKNEALPTRSPGATNASPVSQKVPGAGSPTAVPGGAVPTTPGT